MIASMHYGSFGDFLFSPNGLMVCLLVAGIAACVISIYRSISGARIWDRYWSPLLFASALPLLFLAEAALVDFYVRMYGPWNGDWSQESKNEEIWVACFGGLLSLLAVAIYTLEHRQHTACAKTLKR